MSKCLLLYSKDEYTTATHIENYLKTSKHQVITAGVTKPGLANVSQDRINTPPEFVITDVLKVMPIQPDIVISVQGFYNQVIHGIDLLNIPTVYYGIDTHTQSKDHIFSEAKKYKNVYFAQVKGCVDYLKETGKQSKWLPCCAEPLIHKELVCDNEYDFAFVGGVDLVDAHKPRREALKKLIAEGYQVWVGNAYGFFMSQIYSKAKVVFNYSMNDDINMRLFEGMACNRAVLTNKLSTESGINDLFNDGEHLVSFTDDTLLSKAKKLISDDNYRETIANNGYKEVISKHTYKQRTEDMICLK